jgi:hypothetical protein
VFGAWGGPTVNQLTSDGLTEAGGSSYHDTFVQVACAG